MGRRRSGCLGEFPRRAPTYFKSGAGPAYGSSPSNELFDWLAEFIHSTDVFFVGENITALAFSPDGKFLAMSTANGFVKLWGYFVPAMNHVMIRRTSSTTSGVIETPLVCFW